MPEEAEIEQGIAENKDIKGFQGNFRKKGDLPYGLFIVGKKLFGVCTKCKSIVRVNKPIIGSYHICNP